MCDKQFTGLILIVANFMEIIWMQIKNQDQYFVAGDRAYFAEKFKDYNAFETESEAWLPTDTTYRTAGNNLFELLRTKIINRPHGWGDALLRISDFTTLQTRDRATCRHLSFLPILYHDCFTLLKINSSHSDGSPVDHLPYLLGGSNVDC